MSRKNYLFLSLVLFISFVLFTLVYIENSQVPVTAPDESGPLFFAQNIVENNRFFWESDLNEKYNSTYFRPRSAVEYEDNKYVPLTSFFYSLILALSKLYQFEFMIVSLLAILGVAYMFYIVRDLFDSYHAGIIGAILLTIHAPYLTYANSYFDIIPALVFWLISLRYYLKFIEAGITKYLVLSIIMFSMSVMIRPPMLFLIVFFIPAFLSNHKKFIIKRNVLFSIVTVTLCALAFLGINHALYGSFLSTGRSFIGDAEVGTGAASILMYSVKTIDPTAYLAAFRNYILPYQLLLILGFVGMVLSSREESRRSKSIILGFIMLSLFLFLFFGGNPTQTGFARAQVRGSLSRHFLPLFVMLIVYASYFLSKYRVQMKKSNIVLFTKTFVVLSIVIMSLVTALAGPASFHTVLNRTSRISVWYDFVRTTSENSIFIGKGYTIYAELERPVLLIYDVTDLKENPNLRRFYPIMDTGKQLLPLVRRLTIDGYDLYLETYCMSAKEILSENGYKFREIAGTPFLEVKK